MHESNWNQTNASPPASFPPAKSSILRIPPKQALCECVTYSCPERQEKHRAPGINQEQSLFPAFLPAFCFAATHLTSAGSGALLEGSGRLHLLRATGPALGEWDRRYLHQSTALQRLLKGFRCSREWRRHRASSRTGPTPAGSV